MFIRFLFALLPFPSIQAVALDFTRNNTSVYVIIPRRISKKYPRPCLVNGSPTLRWPGHFDESTASQGRSGDYQGGTSRIASLFYFIFPLFVAILSEEDFNSMWEEVVKKKNATICFCLRCVCVSLLLSRSFVLVILFLLRFSSSRRMFYYFQYVGDSRNNVCCNRARKNEPARNHQKALPVVAFFSLQNDL